MPNSTTPDIGTEESCEHCEASDRCSDHAKVFEQLSFWWPTDYHTLENVYFGIGDGGDPRKVADFLFRVGLEILFGVGRRESEVLCSESLGLSEDDLALAQNVLRQAAAAG